MKRERSAFFVNPASSLVTKLASTTTFAPERSALIELLPADYLSTYYFMLAASRGIAYDAVMGTEPRALRALRRELWRADVIVDVPALERKVARLVHRLSDP